MDSRISSTSVARQPTVMQSSSTVANNSAPVNSAPVELKIPKAEIKVDTETLKKNLEVAINHINEMMRDGGRNLSFSIDPSRKGQPVVIVRKEDTGEVIRQIPNPEVLKVAHSIDALKGLLMNKQI
ncbi:MAG: flagellar protein FlaG [Burkholderiales bacterium]|jgi:flagellar protein FlaG|nr:flagellar protein FlaG [Burkholderiales bacterium]